MANNPIVIIDDDQDDHEIVKMISEEIGIQYPLIHFITSESALEYLEGSNVTPFLVICDVNMPKISGFEIREKLMYDGNHNFTTIPFVFWSNTASQEQIKKAYKSGGHGFFIKKSLYNEVKQEFKNIVDYWSNSQTPNDNVAKQR